MKMLDEKRNIGYSRHRRAGFSLTETLIVIAIFSVLSVIATQILATSLKGSRKSQSIVNVRENLEYAMIVMERNLHSAKRIDSTLSDSDMITYTGQYGDTSTFSCLTLGVVGYIASGSARLTSDKVDVECSLVTVFSFSFLPGNPSSINIILRGSDLTSTGAESETVEIRSKVVLRSY